VDGAFVQAPREKEMTMPRIFRVARGALAVALLTWPGQALATTINPLQFKEMVLGADLVGVVECEKAGGIVAEYRVVESWKGPKAGDRVTIRVPVDYWGEQYPLALCGERYLVMAYKNPPNTLASKSGGRVPLWLRRIKADYQLPLFQGRNLLEPGEEKTLSFDTQRRAAQALIALTPAEQEATLLRIGIERTLIGKRGANEGDPALTARFAKATTAAALTEEMFRLATEDPKKWAVQVRTVLRAWAGAEALARLEKLPAEASPWPKADRDQLTLNIKSRLAGEPRPEIAKDDDEQEEANLAIWRKAFTTGDKAPLFGIAIEKLARHDPEPAFQFLMTWNNPSKVWSDTDRGYVLGSAFACACGKDRTKYLTRLLEAQDPFVKVAGAVYLTFEDRDAGTAALKKLTALEGDAGVWAALTLARRGHDDVLPRLLEVYRLPPGKKEHPTQMAGLPHKNLQMRVLELLSNSARAGGVSQPALPKEDRAQLPYLEGWWRDNRAKVVLRDPWMDILAKQKVD
jgi:hypothetical protein